MGLESISQPFDSRFSLERRKAGTKHKVDGVDQLIREGPDGQECLDRKLLEHAVALTFSSAHQNNHLVTQFEAVGLELDTSGTDVEQETEVFIDSGKGY